MSHLRQPLKRGGNYIQATKREKDAQEKKEGHEKNNATEQIKIVAKHNAMK